MSRWSSAQVSSAGAGALSYAYAAVTIPRGTKRSRSTGPRPYACRVLKTGYLQSRVELPTRCAEARAHGCIECALDAPDPASGRCLGPGSCARGDYRDVTLMRADIPKQH